MPSVQSVMHRISYSSPQVVYSASHIDTIPEALTTSIASSVASSGQQTYSTASTMAPVISLPSSIDPTAMVMGDGAGGGASGGGRGGLGTGSILEQNEVATQIQGAMAGILGQGGGATGIQGTVLGQQNKQGSGDGGPIPGQSGGETVASSIQETMIAQSGAVGGDSIQDTIQDSILGQSAGVGVAGIQQGNILGQPSGQVSQPVGIQDSNQFLTPATGAAMATGSPSHGTSDSEHGSDVGGTSVADIASQLINQYVTGSRAVPSMYPPQAPVTNAMTVPHQEPMQTNVTATTAIPTISTQ